MIASSNRENTAYSEIKKLKNGHAALIKDGSLKIHEYHVWEDNPGQVFTVDDKNVVEYRAELEQTMHDQMVSDYPLGVEISGGMDSSTIAQYLDKFRSAEDEETWGFSEAIYEGEEETIQKMLKSASIKHGYLETLSYYDVQGLIDDTYALIDIIGYPYIFGTMQRYLHFFKLCRDHNIRTMFSGFGGDEVTTSREKAPILWELYNQKKFRAIFNILPGNWVTRVLRTAKFILRKFLKNHPSQEATNVDPIFWELTPLKSKIVEKYNLKRKSSIFNNHNLHHQRHNDQIIKGDISVGLAQERLESCTLMASAFGVDYRWPLWGQRLVQKYLSTPIVERLGPNLMTRYLHRRAIDGLVPDSITWKPKVAGESTSEDLACNRAVIPHIIIMLKKIHEDLHPILEVIIEKEKLLDYVKYLEQVTPETEMVYGEISPYYIIDYTWIILGLNMWLNGRVLKL